jgi:hypothetical protein
MIPLPQYSESKKETWKRGLKLTDLKEGDLIYVHRVINNFSRTYECKFLKFEKGYVYVQILRYYPEWWIPEKEFIKVKTKSCYLWGKDKDSLYKWASCHWLRDGEFI